MAWFGHTHQRRGHRGERPQQSQSQVHIQPYPGGGNPSSHAIYATPSASATSYTVQSTTPYAHQTTSTIQLSSGHSRPQRPRRDPPGLKPGLSSAKWQSCTNLSCMVSETVEKANFTMTTAMTELETQMWECLSSSVDLYGVVLRKLDFMITSMDEGLFTQKDDMGMCRTGVLSRPTLKLTYSFHVSHPHQSFSARTRRDIAQKNRPQLLLQSLPLSQLTSPTATPTPTNTSPNIRPPPSSRPILPQRV